MIFCIVCDYHSFEPRTYKATERAFVLRQMFLDGHSFRQNNNSKNLKYMLHGVVIHER